MTIFTSLSGGPAARPNALAHKAAPFCFALGLIAILSGCATAPASNTAVTTKVFLESPVVSSATEDLTPDELRSITDPDVGAAYILGPDDLITVSVYLHPELSAPPVNGTSGYSGGSGALITSDGTVQLPLIGSVHLGGLTLAQAQQLLTTDYEQYITDPKVSIELAEAQSLRYYLLGAFTTPGIKFPTHPLTLLEAFALGGSVDIAGADLYQAYVAQGNTKLPIDLYALLVQGDMSQNIPLASGDIIVVPTDANENAFVFGAVTKPGAVPFNEGSLSLLQALSESGLDLPSLTDAELSNVHIIRAGGRSAEFIVVNATMIMNGQAESFDLRPGDIVFVPPTPVATWNQVLTELLPSLQTVSAVLNPFVSIKYLRQRG
jgi:polysaccharide export outer membrane protein